MNTCIDVSFNMPIMPNKNFIAKIFSNGKNWQILIH